MEGRILALLLVVPLVLGSAPDECAWGESYWCSNIKIAKSCGAVNHCAGTVWKNQKLDGVQGGEVCQFCEGIISDVRGFLTKKETQDAIKQYVDTACKTIPDAAFAADCQEVFDSFFPEIMNMIESELDSVAICSAIGLCKGAFKDTVHHPDKKTVEVDSEPIPFLLNGVPMGLPSKNLGKGDICADCQTLVQDIKSRVTSDTTEKQIEALLKDSLCANLGGLKAECDTLVEQYVPELMTMLSTEVDPKMVCQALMFCPGGGKTMLAKLRFMKSELYKSASNHQSDDECSICKLAFTELASYLNNMGDQKAVMDFLKQNLCAHLGSLEKECDTSVDQYGPIVFALVKEELSDPEGLCKSIGFCSAKDKVSVVRENTVEKAPAKPVKGPSTQCVLCEFVMQELESLLKGNNTEAEVVAAVEKVCSILPSTLAAECKDFVATYGPAIIELLVSEVTPGEICGLVGLCQTKSRGVSSGQLCGACEDVLMYVDSLLTQNATVHEIEQVLDKVCNFLPDTIKVQCNDLVDQYGPTIAKLLADGLDPQKICTEIGLCQSKDTTLKFVPMEKIVPAKAHLLGGNECTYGPAYWCSSRDNAKRCNAVAHCEKHVWNK